MLVAGSIQPWCACAVTEKTRKISFSLFCLPKTSCVSYLGVMQYVKNMVVPKS